LAYLAGADEPHFCVPRGWETDHGPAVEEQLSVHQVQLVPENVGVSLVFIPLK
jgi:hypothetical protein